jgi:CTD nuclear envelope phosphatase 1
MFLIHTLLLLTLSLHKVGNWFNLVIYTASLKEYADPVIDLLDDGRKLIKKRLFRTSCLSTNTPPFAYLKDLSLVDVDLSKLALIDNSAASFALYPDNAIPIESWREGTGDQGLLDLLPFLDALIFVEDVRSFLSLRRLSLFVVNK